MDSNLRANVELLLIENKQLKDDIYAKNKKVYDLNKKHSETFSVLEKQHLFMMDMEKRIAQVATKSKQIQLQNERLLQSKQKYKELVRRVDEEASEEISKLKINLSKVSAVALKYESLLNENHQLKVDLAKWKQHIESHESVLQENTRLKDSYLKSTEQDKLNFTQLQNQNYCLFQKQEQEQQKFKQLIQLKNEEINSMIKDIQKKDALLTYLHQKCDQVGRENQRLNSVTNKQQNLILRLNNEKSDMLNKFNQLETKVELLNTEKAKLELEKRSMNDESLSINRNKIVLADTKGYLNDESLSYGNIIGLADTKSQSLSLNENKQDRADILPAKHEISKILPNPNTDILPLKLEIKNNFNQAPVEKPSDPLIIPTRSISPQFKQYLSNTTKNIDSDHILSKSRTNSLFLGQSQTKMSSISSDQTTSSKIINMSPQNRSCFEKSSRVYSRASTPTNNSVRTTIKSPANPFFPSRSRESSVRKEDPSFLDRGYKDNEKLLKGLDEKIESLENMFV